MIEFIAALSVICCLAYVVVIVRKAVDKRTNPFSGDMISSHNVNVIYEDSKKPMQILFYRRGFILEHEGERLPVAAYNIIDVEADIENNFTYKITFSPEKDVFDELIIEADLDIGELLRRLISDKTE